MSENETPLEETETESAEQEPEVVAHSAEEEDFSFICGVYSQD
jgi:hypothetical protein